MKSVNIIKNNFGFTLVELIVVLMVISILATITVPMMYGFLDSLEEKDMYTNVDNITNRTKVLFYDLYSDMSYNQNKLDTILDNKDICFDTALKDKLNNFKDCDFHRSKLAEEILDAAGIKKDSASPTFIVLLLGRFDYYMDPTNDNYDPLKAYTLYGMIYQPEKDGKVYYIWEGHDPMVKYERVWDNNKKQYYNRIFVDGESIYVQCYLLKSYNYNINIGNTFWDYVNAQRTAHNGV